MPAFREAQRSDSRGAAVLVATVVLIRRMQDNGLLTVEESARIIRSAAVALAACDDRLVAALGQLLALDL